MKILDKYPNHRNTCSIDNLKDGCFTFARNKKYLENLEDVDIIVLVPSEFRKETAQDKRFEFVENVDYEFTILHNFLSKDKGHLPDEISDTAKIHSSSVIGCEGLHLVKDPDGNRIQLKHLGNVVIEDGVVIMALVTVARSVFSSTTIKRGCVVGHHCNVGHNCYLGENTVLASGVMLGGSSRVGKNCMIGMGAIIRNKVSIVDDVIIGMGSLVVSDIMNPGIYIGNPARFFKPYNRDWNF